MVRAVVELSTVKPHIGDDARFTAITWPIYCAGYYSALCAAVKVMKLAVDRHRTREKFKRAAAAELRKRQAPVPAPPTAPLPATPRLEMAKVHVFPSKNAMFYRPARPLRARLSRR